MHNQRNDHSKVLLMTYPQAEVTGLWTSLISTLGDERCTLSKTVIACPELPDLNEFRGACAWGRRGHVHLASHRLLVLLLAERLLWERRKTRSLSPHSFHDLHTHSILQSHTGMYRRVRNFIGDREDTVILAVGGGSCIDLAKVRR